MALSVRVFPAPDAPRMAVVSPCISKVTSNWNFPNCACMPAESRAITICPRGPRCQLPPAGQGLPGLGLTPRHGRH